MKKYLPLDKPIRLEEFYLRKELPASGFDLFELELHKGNIQRSIEDRRLSFTLHGKEKRIDIPEEIPDKVILESCLYCTQPIQAVFQATVICDACKIWINHTLCAISGGCLKTQIIDMLKQGENSILVEMPRARIGNFLNIRVSSLALELEDNWKSLMKENFTASLGRITMTSREAAQGVYEYLLVPSDRIHLDLRQPIDVCITQREPAAILDVRTCRFFDKLTVDSRALGYHTNRKLNNVSVTFTYKDINGGTHPITQNIFVPGFQQQVLNTLDKFEKNKGRLDLSAYDRLNMEYQGNQFPFESHDDILRWHRAIPLEGILNTFEIGKHMDVFLCEPGFTMKYFRSRLDNQVEYCYVCLPQGYSPAKRYPLVITIALERYSHDSDYLKQYQGEDVIFADISGRGITLGSYVGEAAIEESIAFLFSTYSIDERRIYLVGLCNGGSAAVSYAINHPSMCAGLYIMSSHQNNELIPNLTNIHIWNVSSPSEMFYVECVKTPRPRYRKLGKYQEVLLDEVIHDDLQVFRGKSYFIKELLNVESEKFPDTVDFTTYSSRYLTAYWVAIHAIAFGKKRARVQAKILGNDLHIRWQNITGLTITLPPQLDKKSFAVVINNKKRLEFRDYQKEKVYIVKGGTAYAVVDPPFERIRSRKGLGLLEVYLDPLRIVIADKGHTALLATAQAFAHPFTNGHDPKIYVEYPMVNAETVPAEYFICSLVIIDNNSSIDYCRRIRALCPIQTDRQGFKYGATIV